MLIYRWTNVAARRWINVHLILVQRRISYAYIIRLLLQSRKYCTSFINRRGRSKNMQLFFGRFEKKLFKGFYLSNNIIMNIGLYM